MEPADLIDLAQSNQAALTKLAETMRQMVKDLDSRLQKLERVKEHSLSGRMALDDQVANLRKRVHTLEQYVKASGKLVGKVFEK